MTDGTKPASGQWTDAAWGEAGLGAEIYYNLHRWYRAGLGSYSRPDPIGLGGGVNELLYAGANPLRSIDFLGLFCTTDFVKHYFKGAGGTIELSRVGLLDDFQNAPQVRQQVRRFKRNFFKKMVEAIRQACRTRPTAERGPSRSNVAGSLSSMTLSPIL